MPGVPQTTFQDQQRILGPTAERVHVIEYGWLQRMQTAKLFAYPLGPAEPAGDLLSLHEEARIELRLTVSLLSWWDTVIGTSVGFSGIRLANARLRHDAS